MLFVSFSMELCFSSGLVLKVVLLGILVQWRFSWAFPSSLLLKWGRVLLWFCATRCVPSISELPPVTLTMPGQAFFIPLGWCSLTAVVSGSRPWRSSSLLLRLSCDQDSRQFASFTFKLQPTNLWIRVCTVPALLVIHILLIWFFWIVSFCFFFIWGGSLLPEAICSRGCFEAQADRLQSRGDSFKYTSRN